MLRFVDSMDAYVTASMFQKWNVVANSPIITTGTRNGSGIRTANNVQYITKVFDAQSTWIVGFAFKTSAFFGSSTLVEFSDLGVIQCSLYLSGDTKLSVVKGNATVITGGVSTTGLNTNTWYFIEMKVTIADSIPANSCIVKVNGVEVINVPAGQDTKNHTTSTDVSSITFRGMSSTNIDFDDIYICDGTGAVNNNFLSDSKSIVGLPTVNGSSAQFTPSAGSNWQNIDDTAPDSDTTYRSIFNDWSY